MWDLWCSFKLLHDALHETLVLPVKLVRHLLFFFLILLSVPFEPYIWWSSKDEKSFPSSNVSFIWNWGRHFSLETFQMFSQRKMVGTDDYLETQLQLILINLDKSSNIFWWLLCDSFSLLEIEFNQMLVVGFWLSSALNAIIDLIGLHQPQCSHWPPPAQGHLPLSLLAFSWKKWPENKYLNCKTFNNFFWIDSP